MGTKALSRRAPVAASSGGAGPSGPVVSSTRFSPSRAARAARAGATSSTERMTTTCRSRPAASSASASSLRFSSSHSTTRSGPSSTMAATSGFFVPPTVGTPGSPVTSQNRVTATGAMPQACSVSVAEGTRLTTRGDLSPVTAAPTAPLSQAVEELGLLGVELGLADHAPLAQLVQLLQLLGKRQPPPARGPVGLAIAEALDLPVQRVLHALRARQAGEDLLTALARRLDHEVAGADDALEHCLMEGDVV